MKTNNRKTFLYLMTLTALVTVTAMGFLLTTFNGGVASAQDRAIADGQDIKGYKYDLTPEMISYALNYKSEDLNARYEIMNQLPCMEIASSQLGGRSLKAGVYCVPNANIAGDLKLDAQGDSAAVFIFRVAGALSTKDGARIDLANAAQAANVYFVADSANIGAGTDFQGGIIANRTINVADGAMIRGRMNSLTSEVNAPAGAEAPSAPGFIEICKAAAEGSGGSGSTGLGGRTFTFDITNGPGLPITTVTVPVGSCSAPIAVEAGTQTITERAQGSNTSGGFVLQSVNVLSQSSTSTLGAVNLSTRTATVNVVAGSTANELVLQFVNRTAITGFIEICKEAAFVPGSTTVRDPDVSGMFTFNIEGVFSQNQANPNVRTLQNFTATPGQCTGAIAVTIPTSGFPPTATARVTELARDAGVFLTDALVSPNANPASLTLGRRIDANGNDQPNAGGGYVTLTVNAAADPSNESLVVFINRSTPGLVKVCKIAGPGIPVGEPFTFNVSGTTLTPPSSETSAVTNRQVIVPAGPAAQGGNCVFVPGANGTGLQTFAIGTPVTVDEISPRAITQNNSANDNRPGDVFTSRITTSTNQGSFDLTRTSTRISRAVFNARREVVIVTFTNYTFREAFLKICKIGTGSVIGQTFNFTVAQQDPAGIGLPPLNINVPVRAEADNGQGGGCVIVGGVQTPTSFNANSTITVTEGAAPGTTLTSIGCSTCSGGFTQSAAIRTATFTNGLRPRSESFLLNIVTFTNAPAVPGTQPNPVRFDFDGDGKADLSTFRSSNGIWYLQESTNGFRGIQFGTNNDKLVAADYDGDGKTDVAVYRGGTWFIMGSTAGFQSISFGAASDIPQPGDFDGDGKADAAVFRPSNGTWYMMGSRDGFSAVQFGSNGDKAVASDFDGDGRADVAVYRPQGGTWFINGSRDGFRAVQFGNATDIPVPADFDKDGKVDVAVYRSGEWFIMGSTSGFRAVNFGNATDIPAPADYNGDGYADITVFRNGMWYILDSNTGNGAFRAVQFGNATDTAVPAPIN